MQGGLTTCMELTALRKPFVYIPLRHHFEQNLHVRTPAGPVRGRTDACRTRTAMDPHALAEAIAKEVTREVAYLPVETDGAARAADAAGPPALSVGMRWCRQWGSAGTTPGGGLRRPSHQ